MWGFQNRVCLSVPRKKKSPWLRQYQSYISNWYINGKVFTSTTPWEPRNLIFFSKKFEIEFDLYFDLCWRAEIIQVGLNMHLYDDIGDASSSLWESTSSLAYLKVVAFLLNYVKSLVCFLFQLVGYSLQSCSSLFFNSYYPEYSLQSCSSLFDRLCWGWLGHSDGLPRGRHHVRPSGGSHRSLFWQRQRSSHAHQQGKGGHAKAIAA